MNTPENFVRFVHRVLRESAEHPEGTTGGKMQIIPVEQDSDSSGRLEIVPNSEQANI